MSPGKRVRAIVLLMSGAFLVACASPIKEKRAEFDRKVTTLTHRGFVLERNESTEERGRYLLRLKEPKEVAGFLIRSATGSGDPELKERLTKALLGMGLELDVTWSAYAEGKPASVEAYLLPAEKNATGELARLMRQRKIAADLDFDAKGSLKKIALRPLDETLAKGEKRGRLVVKETLLKVERAGEKPFDLAYRFESGLLRLQLQEDANQSVEIRSEGLDCRSDTSDAYFGTRECALREFVLETDEGKVGGRSRLVLSDVQGSSRVYEANGTVRSDAEGRIAAVTIRGDDGAERIDFEMKDIRLAGEGGWIDPALYRRFVDLLSDTPDTPEAALRKLGPALSEFFRRLLLGYRIEIATVRGELLTQKSGEKTMLELGGLSLGTEWRLDREINVSERIAVQRFELNQSRADKTLIGARLKSFDLDIGITRLYNFMPELMALAVRSVGKTSSTARKEAEKEAEELGKKVLRHGVTLKVDPVKFASLGLQDPSMQAFLGAMEIRLRVTLAPNSLDPANPMAPMLALAYLQAEGRAELLRKDLKQILPLLDPGVQMMVAHFVRYEGEKALFDLRFEQGSLLINGKPLQ